MNRVQLTLGIGAAATCVATSLVFAELLGGTPGFPRIAFDNSSVGTVAYNAGTDLFAVDSVATAARFSPTLAPRPVTGSPRDVTIRAIVNSAGALVGGVPGNDLVINGSIDEDGDTIIDYTGPLVTGEVVGFGHFDSGTNTDEYDFAFTVTGGSLASEFEPGDEFIVKVTSEDSTFTGNFNVNFGGRAKGSGGPECEDEANPVVICSATAVCSGDDDSDSGESDDGDNSSGDNSDGDLVSDDADASSGDASDEDSSCDDDSSSDEGDDDDSDDLFGVAKQLPVRSPAGAAFGDDGDSGGDDDSSDDGDGGVVRINYSATDDCGVETITAVIDIGCAVIPVQDGQLVQVSCDADADSDDDSDSDGDDVGDDDSSSDEGDGGPCGFSIVGGVIVIHSDSAVLIVTATDAAGHVGTCMLDLCAEDNDGDSDSEADDDSSSNDDGDVYDY
jgi:hypothetical protein